MRETSLSKGKSRKLQCAPSTPRKSTKLKTKACRGAVYWPRPVKKLATRMMSIIVEKAPAGKEKCVAMNCEKVEES